jgi:hypothetical protein
MKFSLFARTTMVTLFLTMMLLVTPSVSAKSSTFQPKQLSRTLTKSSNQHDLQHQQPALMVQGGATVTVSNNLQQALWGTLLLALIEKGAKRALDGMNMRFPASLGGCLFLFFGLVLLDVIHPPTAQAMYQLLSPASSFLTTWLPVFFTPGLALLPLAPSIGDGSEVCTDTYTTIRSVVLYRI